MKKVVIIGGGVSGLSAAFTVRRLAEAGYDVDCILLEKNERLGGKVASDLIDDPQGGRYVVDGGTDAYLTAKPAVARISALLGISDEIVPSCDENKKTLIAKGRHLIEMPDGIMMFAPTKLIPMATTRLYSWPAKFRMALDLVLPRKERWAEGEVAQDHDETLESFVVRRMGRECLDRLAEPLVGGVHASDPGRMSLAATFPNFLEMEQHFGSLIRGFLDQRKRVEAARKAHSVSGKRSGTMFSTFRLGMQQLTDALAAAVGPERIRTKSTAVSLARAADGSWQVTLATGEVIDGDAVIIATEIWSAEALVRSVNVQLADLLKTVPCTSSATVSMAFRSEDFPEDRRWFGILCPHVEARPILAVTLSSSKWPDRTPESRVLLRGFIGGPHNQDALKVSDEELIETVRATIADLVGMRANVEPLFTRVYRWEGGMPQYTLGHLDRVDEIERLEGELSSFALAGNAYRGVGVPNCIESGEKAAFSLCSQWGFVLCDE